MASVRFSDVTKRFGGVVAVGGLTLDIAGGEIAIGERVVNRVAPRERDIAMVFQDYALYPQMTVFDNLAFGLRRRSVPREQIGARVANAAELLDIGRLLDRRPGELSGGQQQRVALGRALVREPQVFLMDEPLSNLDAKLRVQTRGEIKRLQQEIATTTVYVTHDQVEAMTMGDRIAVMNAGRLEQVGTPEELYDRPTNRFVAGFIGSPAVSFAPAGELPRVPTDGDVLVGVRPEHARPWADEAGLIGPFDGVVEYAEALGRETFLGVRRDGGPRLVVCVEGRSRAQPGDRVNYGLVPGGLRYFDAQTGDAVQPSR